MVDHMPRYSNVKGSVQSSGLYYKHITIVIVAASVISNQIVASLTIVIDYDTS